MALVTSTLAGSPFMSKQEGNALVRGKDIKGTVVVLSKTQPQQLSLFQTFLPADERYSNTIDLYDAIPKYFPKKRLKKERVEGMFLSMLKREFEFHPTATSIFDMSAATRYAPPAYPAYHQEAPYATSLSD